MSESTESKCPLGFGSSKSSGGGGGGGDGGGSKCPLGFGASSSSSSSSASASAAATATATATADMVAALPSLGLAELRRDGGQRKLLSVKGLVFDVSGRAEDMTPLLGHECSRFFALGGGGTGTGTGTGGGAPGTGGTEHGGGAGVTAATAGLDEGLEGLSYDQVVRLERVLEAFLQSFGPPVAVLAEADRRALFGSDSMVAPGGAGAGGGEEGAAEKGWRLNELIEQGADAAAMEELLAGAGVDAVAAIVNFPCPRTGCAPLHKAVESLEEAAALRRVIDLLVARGANLAAKAALYDDDTPLLLARRLRRGEEIEALLQQHEQLTTGK